MLYSLQHKAHSRLAASEWVCVGLVYAVLILTFLSYSDKSGVGAASRKGRTFPYACPLFRSALYDPSTTTYPPACYKHCLLFRLRLNDGLPLLTEGETRMAAKKINKSDIIGEQGIALIHQRVSAMGLLWYPSAGVEAGIDGVIEMRDPVTGVVFNSIVQVQSKATTKEWVAETATGFEYLCKPEDLEYWLQGNAPVILVVSRPATQEAYWLSIKDYFSDLPRRQARKVYFNKERDCFDETCRDALITLSLPKDAGVYLPPRPKIETIYSNLLEVVSFAHDLYIAETDYRRDNHVWAAFKELDVRVGSEWVLSGKQIVSFYNLDEYPWSAICDSGTIERFDTREWAFSDDPDKQRLFVWLLRKALREKLWPEVRFSKDKHCYYFRATNDLSPRTLPYRSLSHSTSRKVFRAYYSTKRPGEVSFYRHSAFKDQFLCFDATWYLEITPTYYYTGNGHDPYLFADDQLSGIKRLEKNPAVLGQVVMWASHLTREPDLFHDTYPFLAFGALQQFETSVGFDDAQWLGKEEEDKAGDTRSALGDLPLFDV